MLKFLIMSKSRHISAWMSYQTFYSASVEFSLQLINEDLGYLSVVCSISLLYHYYYYLRSKIKLP
jgi:hypothetical protein